MPGSDQLILDSLPPPAIPACRLDAKWGRSEHLLLWVHTGSARVVLATGKTFQLHADEGVWVPAGQDRSVWTTPGSVTLPILIQPDGLLSPPTNPVRFTVPPGWRDWLIQQYVHRVAPITSRDFSHAELLTLLPPGPTPHTRPGLSVHAPADGPTLQLPLPNSVSAGIVAAELLRNPALAHTVQQWSVLAATSPRTLRRDFLRDTGMTFARWRTRCRLAAAMDLLAAGLPLGRVAAQVGFDSRHGLTRAFRGEYGQVPSAIAAAYTERNTSRPARIGFPAPDADPAAAIGSPTDRSVPESYSPPVTYPNSHVLLWNYRGRSWVRVADRSYDQARGDAIWMLAGLPHETRRAANCIDVPIGTVFGPDLPLSRPLRVRFPRSWDTYLLYCSVSCYTMLRPEHYDYRHIISVFDQHLALRRAQEVPIPRHPAGRTAATEFLRSIGAPVRPGRPSPDAFLDNIFRQETGMSQADWQQATRMRIARDLILAGGPPGAVAGRVGYTHLSAFSRAFTRFHGLSPRGYQQREATRT